MWSNSTAKTQKCKYYEKGFNILTWKINRLLVKARNTFNVVVADKQIQNYAIYDLNNFRFILTKPNELDQGLLGLNHACHNQMIS